MIDSLLSAYAFACAVAFPILVIVIWSTAWIASLRGDDNG